MDEGDKLLRGRVREKCKLGLRQAFELIHPDRPVDARGYTHVLADNLIVADLEDDIRSEFGAGAGGELRRMMAVHSSAALAVNAFAPLRRANIRFALAGESNLQVIDFEATRPIADLSRIPPHLDAVCASRDAVVAIESKCTEYLSPKVAAFSDEYLVVRGLPDVSPWFEEMRRIKSADTESYRFLDAAQLIKHAFGLAYAREDRPTTLLYLYWQPRDADLSPLFAEHRAEVERFAGAVAGSSIAFATMTYSDLWEEWLEADNAGLRACAQRLRARYWIPAWAWEGVGFDGQTITDAGFHDLD